MAKKADDVGVGRKSHEKKGSKPGRSVEETLARDVERLRATVDKLEAKLAKKKRKADKWKAAAKAERTRAAKLDAALRRATAERPVDHAPGVDSGDVPVTPRVQGPSDDGTPDGTWTVVRLRAAARRAGIAGSSRKTKAQLLEALDA